MAEIYTITGKINSVSQIDDGSDDWESDESNTVKKRPGPKSRTVIQNLSPQLESHSPLKLTIKRLPTCQEPAFEVVNKKKGRVRGGSASMDDMIPEGLGGSPHPHPVHTPSPTPSDILRPEGVHGRLDFFVVIVALPAKMIFQVTKKVEIARSKVGAVRRMIQNFPAKRVDHFLYPSSGVRPCIVVEEQNSLCQHAASFVLNGASETGQGCAVGF
ncbi:hypothetical protein J6590_031055 [Homalodisca vitripennis]|nr:hypothetical protein J6590_031055 [Homalodisca vitripennis]